MKFWTIPLLLSLAAVGTVEAQGPLTPPGTPAPTMRTLQEIEPRIPLQTLPAVISTPGSYFITKEWDLAGAEPNAISITVSGVTVDLGGYALRNCTSSAIQIANGIQDIRIRNGTISNLGASAPAINAAGATGVRVENLTLHDLGNVAILAGDSAAISGCTFYNGKGAVSVGKSALVKDCLVFDHQPNGNGTLIICQAGPGSVVEDCTVRGSNLAFNLTGATASGLTVEDCVTGIVMDGGSLVNSRFENCGTSGVTAKGATLANVQVSKCAGMGFTLNRGVIRDSIATQNGGGFSLLDTQAIDCQATANTTQGFYAKGSTEDHYPGAADPVTEYSTSALLRGCSANQNQTGYDLNRVNAQNCTAMRNSNHGFKADLSSLTDCTAYNSGSSGFTGTGPQLVNCLTSGNAIHGFDVSRANLRDCVSNSNTQIGFKLAESLATHLTSTSNSQTGISCGDSTTLTESRSKDNANSGITTGNRCTLRNNNADNNGTDATQYAEIFVNGDYNHVEGNHVTGPGSGTDFGIQIRGSSVEIPTAAAHNVVIGNSAGGHPSRNFNFPTGNYIGEILTTSSPATSSSANANFEL